MTARVPLALGFGAVLGLILLALVLHGAVAVIHRIGRWYAARQESRRLARCARAAENLWLTFGCTCLWCGSLSCHCLDVHPRDGVAPTLEDIT